MCASVDSIPARVPCRMTLGQLGDRVQPRHHPCARRARGARQPCARGEAPRLGVVGALVAEAAAVQQRLLRRAAAVPAVRERERRVVGERAALEGDVHQQGEVLDDRQALAEVDALERLGAERRATASTASRRG